MCKVSYVPCNVQGVIAACSVQLVSAVSKVPAVSMLS